MSIRMTCECGQEIVTRDEYAGRRVQCKKCKKVLKLPGTPTAPPKRAATTQLASGAAQRESDEAPQTMIPTAASEPRRAAPATMVEVALPKQTAPATMIDMPVVPVPVPAIPVAPVPAPAIPVAAVRADAAVIAFRCLCGQPYQARRDHIGKPVCCPLCSHILFVPRTSSGDSPWASPAVRKARFSRKGGGGLFLAVLLVLLLGAGAATGLYLTQGGKPQKPLGADERTQTPADFVFGDTFVVRGLPGSGAAVELENLIPEGSLPVREELPPGMTTANVVERRIEVIGEGALPTAWTLVITRDPINVAALLKRLPRGEVTKVKGRDYHVSNAPDGGAVWIVGERLMVFGDKRSMKVCMERIQPPAPTRVGAGAGPTSPPPPPASETHRPALRQALKQLVESKDLAVLLNGRARKVEQVRSKVPQGLSAAESILKFDVALAVGKEGETTPFDVQLYYATETDTTGAAKGLRLLDADVLSDWLPSIPARERLAFLQYLHQQPTITATKIQLKGTVATAILNEISRQLFR